ncbi:MAG: hypothetical protein ACFFDT_03305, partial [Candidatus Hodarchaeota archaeon]
VNILGIWYLASKSTFSTIPRGVSHLSNIRSSSIKLLIGLTVLFVSLAFLLLGMVEHIIVNSDDDDDWVVPLTYAVLYIVLIFLAIVILTYEPAKVYDVLLVRKYDGIPVASHIELFQSDEVLISGLFSALTAVSEEIGADASSLKSVKRGDREILIEEGVLTRIIALADQDQVSIRQQITNLHKQFEIVFGEKVTDWLGDEHFSETKNLVETIGKLSIRFNIPQQTRWIGVLTLAFTPLMIALIGII